LGAQFTSKTRSFLLFSLLRAAALIPPRSDIRERLIHIIIIITSTFFFSHTYYIKAVLFSRVLPEKEEEEEQPVILVYLLVDQQRVYLYNLQPLDSIRNDHDDERRLRCQFFSLVKPLTIHPFCHHFLVRDQRLFEQQLAFFPLLFSSHHM